MAVEWRRAARKIWEEAFAVDPDYTEEVTRAIVGCDVFAWDLLHPRKVRALHRYLFATARLT